jgi:hypothetical protein
VLAGLFRVLPCSSLGSLPSSANTDALLMTWWRRASKKVTAACLPASQGSPRTDPQMASACSRCM